jgi:pimeloyl-ACP methyl ester carboxylesterase
VASLTVYEPVLFSLLLHYQRRLPELLHTIRVAQSMKRRLAAGQPMEAAARFVDYWSGAGTWDATPEARREALAPRMQAVVSHFDALFGAGIDHRQLRALRMPVQLMCGTRTLPVARRAVELLQYALPQAELVRVEGAGHMGPVTHGPQVNALIAGFLARVAGSRRDTRPGNEAWAQAA